MVVDPFDVALGELRDCRGTLHAIRRGVLTEALVADVDSRVPAGAEAVADVSLDAFDGGVGVRGTVCSRWEGECRRCLRSLDGEISADVRELFRRGGGDDEGTYRMAEDHLNLREMVLDALFAALPVLPLCREDCRGICPRCGADRNTAPCACREVEVDHRWAALDALRLAHETAHETGAEAEPLG
ncbi:MAG TPA: DUF177 domain-containing protein [Acidimicrobiales bacterium]|nr:DUF177 domain-containing protein [Acidimicrobiales bacterium]